MRVEKDISKCNSDAQTISSEILHLSASKIKMLLFTVSNTAHIHRYYQKIYGKCLGIPRELDSCIVIFVHVHMINYRALQFPWKYFLLKMVSWQNRSLNLTIYDQKLRKAINNIQVLLLLTKTEIKSIQISFCGKFMNKKMNNECCLGN